MNLQIANGDIVAEYESTAEEQFAFVQEMTKDMMSPGSGRAKYRWWLLAGSFLAGLLLRSSGFFETLRLDHRTAGLVIGLLLLVTLFSCWVIMRSRKTKLMTILSSSKRSRTVTVRTSADGLSWQTKSEEHWLACTSVDRVWQSKLGVMLRSGLWGGYFPDRSFKSPEQKDKFLSLLRSSVPAGAFDTSITE